MRVFQVWLCFVVVASLATQAGAQTVGAPAAIEEGRVRWAPIDYGHGPGIPRNARPRAVVTGVPAGGPDARTKGVFGPAVEWSLIPVHGIVLPDGRILTYGIKGAAGQLEYDVWDPALGSDEAAHLELPNMTLTDIFCSGQSLLAGTGQVLLTGGSITLDGVQNNGIDSTTIFDPQSNAMSTAQPMVYQRWYPSIVPLTNGDKLILGGRETSTIYSPTPEVFTQAGEWRTLSGATSDLAYGNVGNNWSYPRAYQMPNDPETVFVLGHDGNTYHLKPAGEGALAQLKQRTFPSNPRLPTVSFAPGKLLSLRNAQRAVVVDINGARPTISNTAAVSQVRLYSNATVLADGKVMVNGGSSDGNVLTGAAYATETWDPASGTWTMGAVAAKPRLYHSNALLLPDGSVFTGGGGAPGPVRNMNAEIYYPPYLFDADGNPAVRPTLNGVPGSIALGNSAVQQFTATVGEGDRISRVTMLHAGSATHGSNLEQSFRQLPFTQDGATLTITPARTVPGYYLLFVFNDQGVPSHAKIVRMAS